MSPDDASPSTWRALLWDVEPPPRWFTVVPAIALVLAIGNVNVPYFSISPGPATDVGGLIAIDGVETHPSKGRLFLTTVSLSSLRVVDAVRAWFDETQQVVDRDLIIPPGSTRQDVNDENTRQMEESQAFAAAAALQALGYDVRIEGSGARVVGVLADVPAASVLQQQDVIVEAAGRPVRTDDELVSAIAGVEVGAELALQVERRGERLALRVRTVEDPRTPGRPIVGISIETVVADIVLPFDVQIDSNRIGGPSAGLMFALGIVDVLRPEDLTGGRRVAGTGVIDADGVVGAVGGVRQKVFAAERADADLFLVPASEVEQACDVSDEIDVIGVQTLAEALAALADPGSAGTTCDAIQTAGGSP